MVFDLLEIGITWAKPGTKKNAQFFYLIDKKWLHIS